MTVESLLWFVIVLAFIGLIVGAVALGVVWLASGRARTYRYGRGRDTLAYDRGYDDRVVVEDHRSYRPLARRRRFF